MLVVPDSHRPYHDERAWQLMIQVGKFIKPHHIAVIGDLADFYSVSSHSKDPSRIRHLKTELRSVNKGLDELDALGAKNKEFIEGNHCDRLSRYLSEKAPELFGLVDTPQLLRLNERGWNYTPYKSHTKIGKLHLTHDVGNAGRYATFKALDAFQHSVVTGHCHRMQYIVEGNAVGNAMVSAQFGWLGDTNKIDYMHALKVKRDWALGFGVGYIHPKTEIAYLVPVPIVNYTVVVNGVYFSG